MLIVGLVGTSATPPAGYYDTAEGKTGAALRAALHDIIDEHHSLPYSSTSFDTHDAINVLDQDLTNSSNVILIYSRRSEPKANWGNWNREHLWPNSYGLDNVHPGYSDLHNLRACDQNVNSSRGNKFFDWSDTNSPGYAFPAHPEAPLCSSDTDSWQPPAAVRGNIARAQFYMAVRYEGDAPNEQNLELTDDTAVISSATNLMGRLTTLLQWHYADAVDEPERLRNDQIYSLYQTNRNPFVDRPEFVDAVFIPRLAIATSINGVRLRWNADGAPMQLQSSAHLPPVWQTVTNAPAQDGQGWFVELPAEGLQTFYRLKL